MQRIVTAGQMADIDRLSEAEYGLAPLVLMENAGLKAVRHFIEYEFHGTLPAGRFVFLAGRGNNGGDALVMARHFVLSGKDEVSVILANGLPAEGNSPAVNLNICRALGIEIRDWQKEPDRCRELLAACRFVFDGILGTGLKGEPTGPSARLIEAVNAASADVVAVDVPSGLGDSFKKGGLAVRAELTITFGLPKLCLYLPFARPLAGRIAVVDPGFPPALLHDTALPGEFLGPEDFDDLLPPPAPEAHKNTRGHAAVFSGAPGTSGAAVLCSEAAARCRAGLVTLYTDPAVHQSLSARLISVMCRPVTAETFDPQEVGKKYRALLIGPGFGLSEDKKRLAAALLGIGLPKVVDADGLTLLAGLGPDAVREAADRSLILTPHPGECARLLGKTIDEILASPVDSTLEVCRRFQAVCILKTHVTFIGAPDGRFTVMDGMNPALGTGGSGDVLAGMVAGFLAQGIDGYACARLGALLHARTGLIASREKGWFLAEDLLDYVSQALAGRGARART
ncbi:MAG: NAD(P)H-hydrate dehydratase [Spirochaetales bacterium]|nr:NAD(P)H-hydrate dehydratase [Spirochaetales bacterium]